MSRSTTEEEEYKRLRGYLNPAISGPNTNAILHALASSVSVKLVNNVEFVHDQIYIASAVDRYLDQRLSDYGLNRPANVGLSDDIFRDVGISVVNRKQVRDLILSLLTTMFGEETTRATAHNSTFEPYQLQAGDTLRVRFDGQDPVNINFSIEQFTNINTATAQEVADAITKELRRQGKTGSAFAKDDGLGPFVTIISNTSGPSSSVTVTGGRAQNALKFDQIRGTTGTTSTQWTVTQVAGGALRFTWTGGSDPSVGKCAIGDYVNIYGTSFSLVNRGTFTITNIQGGVAGQSYFEIVNPNGVSEVVVQGTNDAVLFFFPFRNTISTKNRYAAVYQTEQRLLQIFMPATTKVVRRDRIGSAHLNDNYVSGTVTGFGPYIYDLGQAYTVSDVATLTTASLGPDSSKVIQVANSSSFPDTQGHLIIGYGTSHQEGPVPYLARPSNGSILINPSYNIKNIHPVGTDVCFISRNGPVQISQDGTDYPFYITGTADGRAYAQDLINTVVATGIKVVVTILYPSDEGLSKYFTEYSEKTLIWGD
jgi:hypothetical protein